MAVLAPPVQVVASGAPPFVQVTSLAPPFVVTTGPAQPITIVASGAPPITLLNDDGSIWSSEPSAAPVNTVLPAISGTPTVGQTISATTGTWTGSPSPTYTYQWKRAGASISGETASTYTLVALDTAALITVTVTATNASGAVSATSASFGTINLTPSNAVIPAITGTATVGQTLTSSTGTWLGTPVPTYGYQWNNAGVAIGGATSSTYVLQASDVGDLITVTVTGTNTAGSASATSTSVGPIAAVGGAALLSGETNGFASDFTYATDANRAAKTVSSTITEYGLDSFFTQAGTSPKMVCDVSGTLGWSPHNMFLNSASPATQSVTTVVGQNYTVKVVGSGTLTGSAGASGTATSGSPLTFTATTTTSTFTLSGGTPTSIQMNRGSVATAYLATTGSIVNGIAVDYHPTTHAALGMVYELAATNMLYPSSPAATGLWTKRGTVTFTTGQTGPTGAATATLVAGVSHISTNDFFALVTGFTASARVEPSFFIKKVTTTGNINCSNPYNGSLGEWIINLASIGSGWERITRTHPAVTTITTEFAADGSGGSGPHFYASDGASIFSFYLDFVQMEQGTISTSPIRTFGATVTRAADNYTFLLSSMPSLGSDYSIYCRFSTPSIASAKHVFVVTDGTTNEYAGFLTNTTARLAVVDGGSAVGAITGATVVANTAVSLAARIKANDCALSVGGAAVGTDATVTLPTVTEVRFGGVGSNAVTTGVYYLQKMVIAMPGWSNATLVTKSGS